MASLQLDDEKPDFPALVRQVRVARGFTQEGLARELGVSFATVNGWENGRHRPIPSLASKLQELAGGPAPSAKVSVDPSPPVTAASSKRDNRDGGWPLHPQERRDFYHRPRVFPGAVATWRGLFVDQVLADKRTFPGAKSSDVVAIRKLIDDGISHIREVARIAALVHGNPRLGNKTDPVDELVYIILARKTREDAYQAAFDALKSCFSRWDELLDAKPREVERLLSSSGLGQKKTASIFGALGALKARFGSCTLEPARAWSDSDLEAFLCSLPELHRKSAYCIMLYAFDRAVFPVDTHVGRVLARLGPYRELGLQMADLDHKKLQAVLADLVPPNLRYSLHVNLLAHGREVCRPQKPLCGECELRKLCNTYRQGQAARVESLERPRIADLFTGAGGLSEGFQQAGFEVALALDLDESALRTYWYNHPAVRDERILCRDIREMEKGEFRRRVGKQGIDLLIGAPPCQGFSHVGNRSKSSLLGYTVATDERNYLYQYMIGAALELRPRLFLMENVPGMQSAKNGDQSFLDAAARDLENAGFKTTVWRLNAAAYGVPQDRLRYFLVAARGMRLPQRPEETHQDTLARDVDTEALPPVTLDEAIFDLPALPADGGEVIDFWRASGETGGSKYRRYLAKFGLMSSPRFIFNHTVRYHNERDLELYSLLRPGEDSVHALERHGRADLMRYRHDVFDDKYARLRPDRPSKTIVAHLAKDGNGYIHPTQVRSLSFREAARLQSFRDDYVFCGSPSDQWVQLGNAVPPLLARAIAYSFKTALGA